MSTESPVAREIWKRVHAVNKHVAYGGSAVNKQTYIANGGPDHTYHLGADEIPRDNGYSVHYFGDKLRNIIPKLGPANKNDSCAIDLTPTGPHAAEDMRVYTKRLIAAWRAGKLYGVREFAGTVNGRDVYAIDTSAKKGHRQTGSQWDPTHKYHNHIGWNRRWSRRMRIVNAIAECYRPVTDAERKAL